MTRAGICLLLAVSLTACGTVSRVLPSRSGQSATPLPFRAAMSRSSEDRRDFTVTVRAPGATLDEVRESARFPATRYCLETFGGSPVDWTLDPATGDWAVAATAETLTVSGRCVFRG